MTSDGSYQPKKISARNVFRPDGMRAVIVPSALFAFALVSSLGIVPAHSSSHREAPLITSTPKLDGTDFYMFRSYEPGRDGFVTLIADYIPLEERWAKLLPIRQQGHL
jgi:Domain of unknown function (DUF4331)